jgi:hypothetical protein
MCRQKTLHIHNTTHVQSTTEHPTNTMYSTGMHTTLYYVCRRIHGLQLLQSNSTVSTVDTILKAIPTPFFHQLNMASLIYFSWF